MTVVSANKLFTDSYSSRTSPSERSLFLLFEIRWFVDSKKTAFCLLLFYTQFALITPQVQNGWHHFSANNIIWVQVHRWSTWMARHTINCWTVFVVVAYFMINTTWMTQSLKQECCLQPVNRMVLKNIWRSYYFR